MIRSFLLFSAALVLLLPAGLQAKDAKDAGSTTETISQQFNTISAKVIGIDKATHTLTLENDMAERRKIQVDPSLVKNFDNIKVGDLVVVREKQSLALTLTKHQRGQKPGVEAAMTAESAKPGSKPAVGTKETLQISAEIVKINRSNLTVNLKGPEGNIVQLRVQDPQRLAGLKKGDMVTATYTKAMAISVEPAPAK